MYISIGRYEDATLQVYNKVNSPEQASPRESPRYITIVSKSARKVWGDFDLCSFLERREAERQLTTGAQQVSMTVSFSSTLA